jgi:Ca-activated chloride channel family protein
LIEQAIARQKAIGEGSTQLQFAAAVAAFGEALRGGKYLDGFNLGQVAALAEQNIGQDRYGMKAELVELIGRAAALSGGDEGQIAIAK